MQAQAQYQQQNEQQKRDLESLHQKTVQQLQNRLKELENVNKELMERRYKGDSTVRELKAKLSGIEDVSNIHLLRSTLGDNLIVSSHSYKYTKYCQLCIENKFFVLFL